MSEDQTTDAGPPELLPGPRNLLPVFSSGLGGLLAIFGLVVGMSVILIGLFSIAAQADPNQAKVGMYDGSVALMGKPAWIPEDGRTVMRYEVLYGLVLLISAGLTVLVSASLATLLHASVGDAKAACRAWITALLVGFGIMLGVLGVVALFLMPETGGGTASFWGWMAFLLVLFAVGWAVHQPSFSPLAKATDH